MGSVLTGKQHMLDAGMLLCDTFDSVADKRTSRFSPSKIELEMHANTRVGIFVNVSRHLSTATRKRALTEHRTHVRITVAIERNQ